MAQRSRFAVGIAVAALAASVGGVALFVAGRLGQRFGIAVLAVLHLYLIGFGNGFQRSITGQAEPSLFIAAPDAAVYFLLLQDLYPGTTTDGGCNTICRTGSLTDIDRTGSNGGIGLGDGNRNRIFHGIGIIILVAVAATAAGMGGIALILGGGRCHNGSILMAQSGLLCVGIGVAAGAAHMGGIATFGTGGSHHRIGILVAQCGGLAIGIAVSTLFAHMGGIAALGAGGIFHRGHIAVAGGAAIRFGGLIRNHGFLEIGMLQADPAHIQAAPNAVIGFLDGKDLHHGILFHGFYILIIRAGAGADIQRLNGDGNAEGFGQGAIGLQQHIPVHTEPALVGAGPNIAHEIPEFQHFHPALHAVLPHFGVGLMGAGADHNCILAQNQSLVRCLGQLYIRLGEGGVGIVHRGCSRAGGANGRIAGSLAAAAGAAANHFHGSVAADTEPALFIAAPDAAVHGALFQNLHPVAAVQGCHTAVACAGAGADIDRAGGNGGHHFFIDAAAGNDQIVIGIGQANPALIALAPQLAFHGGGAEDLQLVTGMNLADDIIVCTGAGADIQVIGGNRNRNFLFRGSRGIILFPMGIQGDAVVALFQVGHLGAAIGLGKPAQ